MRHASAEHELPEPGHSAGGGHPAGGGRHAGRRRSGEQHGTGPVREAGQEAGRAPPGRPLRLAQLPYLAVLLGAAVALAIIRQGVHLVQRGTLVFAGVLLIAALARLVLPERRAGMLASRRRLLDVAIFGMLGIGLLVAGFVVPVPS